VAIENFHDFCEVGQGSGESMVPLIRDGILNESVASWTTNKNYAQDFKDPLRTGTVSAIFAHRPKAGEVVLNIEALWATTEFQTAVANYKDRDGPHANALLHFKSRQSEVILNAPLLRDEIVGFCGRSSPFETLCGMAGIAQEEEKDLFWKHLVEGGTFPEQARWLSPQGVKNVLERVRTRFNL